MRKRRVIILVAAIVAVLGLMWWALSPRPPNPPDPVYEGHRLSYWLDRSSPSNALGYHGFEVNESFYDSLDSDAVPYLIHTLKATDGLMRRIYLRVWLRLPLALKRHLRAPLLQPRVLAGWTGYQQGRKPGMVPMFASGPISGADLRLESCVLLSWVGADARPAIPELVHLLREDEYSQVRWCAALALGKIANPDDKTALDALNAAILKDQDQVTKNWAGRALSDIATRAAAKAGVTNAPESLWHPKDDSRL